MSHDDKIALLAGSVARGWTAPCSRAVPRCASPSLRAGGSRDRRRQCDRLAGCSSRKMRRTALIDLLRARGLRGFLAASFLIG